MRISRTWTILVFTIFILTAAALGQTTAFSYQGKLNDGAMPASGSYLLRFRLFDAGGSQVGPTLTDVAVTATDGIFSARLDFGSDALSGADRFLEISVRRNAGESYTTLSPRQQIASSPYSVRTLSASSADNADRLGGTPANQYLQTNGSGSGLTNLNADSITSGTLANTRLGQIPTANIADNAITSPKIASGQVVKSINTLRDNVTLAAGTNVTITPSGNTLTIAAAGGAGGCPSPCTAAIFDATQQYNLGGSRVLSAAGKDNLFAGVGAGQSTTGGNDNSFFGASAGFSNTTSSNNSFFGASTGFSNTTGFDNSFFGASAGFSNTTGFDNAFFGALAGSSNTTGRFNLFSGSGAGFRNVTGAFNTFVGGGAGQENTEGDFNSYFGRFAGDTNVTGDRNTIIGANADVDSANLTNATAIGAGVLVTASNHVQIGRILLDTVAIGAFGTPASSTAVCINGLGVFTSCNASSLRYKEGVRPFRTGLSVITKLRPVEFEWKQDNQTDFGLVAEDVAAVEPLLSSYNNKGEIDGVKYDRLNVMLINAVKEQQLQIERLKTTVKRQQMQIRQIMRGRTARGPK